MLADKFFHDDKGMFLIHLDNSSIKQKKIEIFFTGYDFALHRTSIGVNKLFTRSAKANDKTM